MKSLTLLMNKYSDDSIYIENPARFHSGYIGPAQKLQSEGSFLFWLLKWVLILFVLFILGIIVLDYFKDDIDLPPSIREPLQQAKEILDDAVSQLKDTGKNVVNQIKSLTKKASSAINKQAAAVGGGQDGNGAGKGNLRGSTGSSLSVIEILFIISLVILLLIILVVAASYFHIKRAKDDFREGIAGEFVKKMLEETGNDESAIRSALQTDNTRSLIDGIKNILSLKRLPNETQEEYEERKAKQFIQAYEGLQSKNMLDSSFPTITDDIKDQFKSLVNVHDITIKRV